MQRHKTLLILTCAAACAQPRALSVSDSASLAVEGVPDDPLFAQQWPLAKIRAPDAWRRGANGAGVVVAIVDTGITTAHPDLADALWVNEDEIDGNGIDDDGNGYIDDRHGFNFIDRDAELRDLHGRGTAVASVIAARADDGYGMAGIAWASEIMTLKVPVGPSPMLMDEAIEAIRYGIDNGADIIVFGHDFHSYLLFIPFGLDLREVMEEAHDAGVLVVAGATHSKDKYAQYPAAFALPNIISVAGSGPNDEPAHAYDAIASVDLFAPGRDITVVASTDISEGHVETWGGPAIAAAHAAGAAALLLGDNVGMSATEARTRILGSVQPLDGLELSIGTGGRLDAGALVVACAEHDDSIQGHIAAGRAERCGSWNMYACAVGSGDNLGFAWGWGSATLYEIESGYFATAACPTGDNAAPALVIIGDEIDYIAVGDTYSDAGAVASDAEDGDLTAAISVDGVVDANTPGVYRLRYDVEDSEGRRSVTERRAIIVLDDNEQSGPVLVPYINAALGVPVGGTYLEPGYFAWEPIDGLITGTVVVAGSVDTSSPQVAYLHYSVQTARGEAEFYRPIPVLDDRPQVYLRTPARSETVSIGTSYYYPPSASAYDLEDGDLTSEVVQSGTVQTSVVGTYLITYDVTDSDGLTGSMVYSVEVVSDGEAPVLTLLGDAEIVIGEGELFEEPGATAIDDVDGDISGQIVVSGRVDTSIPATYVLRYDVRDAAGNDAPSVERRVEVTPAPQCQAYDALLSEHVQAARAHPCAISPYILCAVGSEEILGTTFFDQRVTLREEAPGSFVRGTCD